MDYINYVKQSPMSMSGMGGPVGALNFHSSSGGTWSGGDRGVFMGGLIIPSSPYHANKIDYVTITSTGNATNFGTLSTQRSKTRAAGSNGTRGIQGGGQPFTDIIDYVTIASTGNASDFGDLDQACSEVACCSNSIRGVFCGGSTPGAINTMQYVTIDTTGDTTDFGDLDNGNRSRMAEGCNGERGVLGGGAPDLHSIWYFTMGTLGNTSEFGDLTGSSSRGWGIVGGSNDTRAIFMGGTPNGSDGREVIDYITIATTGNATDFGDWTNGSAQSAGTANSTRCLAGGADSGGDKSNTIEYVTIDTPGNASDFGDLTQARADSGATSGD